MVHTDKKKNYKQKAVVEASLKDGGTELHVGPLCKIWGYRNDVAADSVPQRYDAVSKGNRIPTFQTKCTTIILKSQSVLEDEYVRTLGTRSIRTLSLILGNTQ